MIQLISWIYFQVHGIKLFFVFKKDWAFCVQQECVNSV